MTDACELPRKIEARPRRAFDACAIDLGDNRVEFVVQLYEHETAGMRIETWPATVQNLFEKHVAAWREKHPSVTLRAITCGVVERSCVLILHYAEKPA